MAPTARRAGTRIRVVQVIVPIPRQAIKVPAKTQANSSSRWLPGGSDRPYRPARFSMEEANRSQQTAYHGKLMAMINRDIHFTPRSPNTLRSQIQMSMP